MGGEEPETTTRYVCSACGYTQIGVEPVVEHIDEKHGGDAHVMEYEAEMPDGRLAKLLGRMEEWLS